MINLNQILTPQTWKVLKKEYKITIDSQINDWELAERIKFDIA